MSCVEETVGLKIGLGAIVWNMHVLQASCAQQAPRVCQEGAVLLCIIFEERHWLSCEQGEIFLSTLELQAYLRDSEVLSASRIIHSHVQPGCKDVLVVGGYDIWQHCRSQSWLLLTRQGAVCGHLPRQLDLALHRPILHSHLDRSDESDEALLTQGCPESHLSHSQIMTSSQALLALVIEM